MWPELRLAPARADFIMARGTRAPTQEAEDTSAVRPPFSSRTQPGKRAYELILSPLLTEGSRYVRTELSR